MAGKVRLKIGPIEVECDGEIGTSNAQILALAEAAADLYHRKGLGQSSLRVAGGASVGTAGPDRLRVYGSAASIASRLNCISGPELVIAASAWLTFVNGEEWFEASRLLEEMKKAAAHYDRSYQETLLPTSRGW